MEGRKISMGYVPPREHGRNQSYDAFHDKGGAVILLAFDHAQNFEAAGRDLGVDNLRANRRADRLSAWFLLHRNATRNCV